MRIWGFTLRLLQITFCFNKVPDMCYSLPQSHVIFSHYIDYGGKYFLDSMWQSVRQSFINSADYYYLHI